MSEVRAGMAAVSMAGHDTGRYYIIVRAVDGYVYLADGTLRTCEHPKKKKMRHVQINRRISPEIESILSEGGEWKNETIKRVVKEYRRKQEV